MFLPRAWRWYRRNYLRRKYMTVILLSSPAARYAAEVAARYV